MDLMTQKRAEMGVGTLIVFIAMLLVAAVAAGVLIQTASSLQEKSLSTGQQARTQISTNIKTIEVSATDASDGKFETVSSIYKLAPGSDPVKLNDVLYMESTSDSSVSLKLRDGADPINDVFTGYYTASPHAYESLDGAFADPVPSEFYSVFSTYETSEFMIGKIAVNIIFVESDGSIDPNTENWTTGEKEALIQYTENAINWWNAIEPKAGIRATFRIYDDVPISYEPVSRDSSQANQELWMNETLDYINVPSGASYLTRLRNFNHQTRQEMNANWAFTIVYTPSSNTPGGAFTDNACGIAYLNGPYFFYGGSCDAPRQETVIAHEMGHIFGATDQYAASGCACNDSGGYYEIATENCEIDNCILNQTSLMRVGSEAFYAYDNNLIDVFALAQMGLVDQDENGILDPVDLLFENSNEVEMTNLSITSIASNSQYYVSPARQNGRGFFTYEFMQRGTNNRDNVIQRGDIIKVIHESSKSLGEDETVRLSIIPKIGTQTLTEFVTPDVMASERIYLYP